MSDKEKPLTKWEAGNELVRIADEIGKSLEDLKNHPEIYADIKKLGEQLSAIFKKHGMEKELGFGI